MQNMLLEHIIEVFIGCVLVLFLYQFLKALYSVFDQDNTEESTYDTHGFPGEVYWKIESELKKKNIFLSDDQWNILLDEYKANGMVIPSNLNIFEMKNENNKNTNIQD